jgi:hypothetical protein
MCRQNFTDLDTFHGHWKDHKECPFPSCEIRPKSEYNLIKGLLDGQNTSRLFLSLAPTGVDHEDITGYERFKQQTGCWLAIRDEE